MKTYNSIPVLVKDVADVEISNLPRLGHVGRADAIFDASGSKKIVDDSDAVEAIVVMRKGANPIKRNKGGRTKNKKNKQRCIARRH